MHSRLSAAVTQNRTNGVRSKVLFYHRQKMMVQVNNRNNGPSPRIVGTARFSCVHVVGNPRNPASSLSSSSSPSSSANISFSTLNKPRSEHRPLHTNIPRLAPIQAAATLDTSNTDDETNNDNYNDNDGFVEDIERLMTSNWAHYPSKNIFYDPNDRHGNYITGESLNDELGMDTIWDKTEEDFYYNDDDNIDIDNDSGDSFINQAGEEDGRDYDTSSSAANKNNNTQRVSSSPTTSFNMSLRKQSAIEMLRNFDAQDPPTTDNLDDLQLWLECAAQREAVLKYQTLIEKARDRKAFDSMPLMQQHVIRWYQSIRDAIDARQKQYMSSSTDTRRGKNRYGPFLCSLRPEKLAVIVSHEAITHALLHKGRKNDSSGVPLVSITNAIGTAVETEVISQRRIREKFFGKNAKNDNDHSTRFSNDEISDDVDDDDGDDDGDDVDNLEDEDSIGDKPFKMDRWMFSASHIKKFREEISRMDPKAKKSNRAINYAIRRAKQAINSRERWTVEDITHLGAVLLAVLIENSTVTNNGVEEPAFSIEKKWIDKGKSTSYVTLNENLFKLFLEDNFHSFAATTTRHAPMIQPPRDWIKPDDGGYQWLKVDLMRYHGNNLQKEALQHADLSIVFDGLNVMGRTPWRINKKILDVAQQCWKTNVAIGDIPTKTDFDVPDELERPEKIPVELFKNTNSPEYQAAMDANKAYRESVFKNQRIQQKNMDLRSLRCSAVLKLDQAEKFKDFERIYFPYNLDFRGRAYPVPPHLSNVGSDLCRGMLTFADAKPLGDRGLFWLKVHLANLAGKDKMPFEDRAQFIADNLHHVRASVDNPFSEDPWWMGLDDPFQGLATCHEIINAIDSGDPESYMCSLPVHMDGSCNGLQHYAALGRDTTGGKAVNLCQGDGPEDVYSGVMHEVIRRVAEEAKRELDFDASDYDSLTRKQKRALKFNKAAKLVNGLIDRGVVKRTVMTSVYGVTYVGARQQIQEKIEEKLEDLGHDVDEMQREIFAASGYLATLTIEVMGDVYQGAKKTKSWLAECARKIARNGLPVAWISPIGIPVIQPYRQKRSNTVVTVLQSVTIADASDDLPIHRSRQVTAFPPNYIHSLDSSHMLLTALEMDRRGLSFSAVHDSFWTHPCDVDEMNEALRDCFVDLYERPLLDDLKKSWEMRYPDIDFPDLPDIGDLDLNEVKSATYFFQ